MAFSIWETSSFQGRPDVVVVGSGIVGLFTALFYKRQHPEHHVLVLEKGAFPIGASVKNAGFACFGSPSELLADMAREGEDKALQRVEERWKGLLDLRAELGDAAIGYLPCGGHEVYRTHDPQYNLVASGFDHLNDALKPIFGRQAYNWNDQGIASNGIGGMDHMACTELEGGLDSGALMRSLLSKAQGEGVLVRSGTEVSQIEEGPGRVEIRSAQGEHWNTSQVVLATNGYTSGILPSAGIRPARGQVLITEPIPGLRLHGTFHADEGYYYFRDLNGAVLLGGGRNLDVQGETTTEEGTSPRIQNALGTMLREVILPGVQFKVAKRWSGIMGFPNEGKSAVVARHGERTIVAAGLSGMGVALGIRVARKAAQLLDGRN